MGADGPGELALFGPEASTAAPLPPLKEAFYGALVVKWTKVKQPARGGSVLCADCIKRAQERGVAGAPVPRRAAWKRTGPIGELALCVEDAQRHRDADDRVQREYADRMAHREHAGRHRS